jgi:hypothetical protein
LIRPRLLPFHYEFQRSCGKLLILQLTKGEI